MGVSPKLQRACLFGVQFQAEAFQPLFQCLTKRLSLPMVLETKYCVVGVPDNDHISTCTSASLLLYPKIIGVVQVNVVQNGRDNRSLRYYAPLRNALALLIRADLEPFVDQPDQPFIRDPVLEEPYRPVVLHTTEEFSDIGIHHPVHFLTAQGPRGGVKRIMLPLPGRKP